MHDVTVVVWLGGVDDGYNNWLTGVNEDVCCTCALTNCKKDDQVKLLSNISSLNSSCSSDSLNIAQAFTRLSISQWPIAKAESSLFSHA